MKIVACNSNLPLAEAVAAELNMSLCNASVRRFADMEVFVEIFENVRGEDVFVVQSTCMPTNDNLMELLIMLDALRMRTLFDILTDAASRMQIIIMTCRAEQFEELSARPLRLVADDASVQVAV